MWSGGACMWRSLWRRPWARQIQRNVAGRLREDPRRNISTTEKAEYECVWLRKHREVLAIEIPKETEDWGRWCFENAVEFVQLPVSVCDDEDPERQDNCGRRQRRDMQISVRLKGLRSYHTHGLLNRRGAYVQTADSGRQSAVRSDVPWASPLIS